MVSLHAALVAVALSGVGQTVMFDFYADWCGPCKAMNPTVEALIKAGFPVQRVNIDQNRPLAARYRVESIPCFVMVVDGKEVDRVTGGTTYSRLERMCQAGAANTPPNAPPTMLAQNTPSPVQPASFTSTPPMTAPFEGWGQPTAPNPPASLAAAATPSGAIPDANLLAASVRIRVEDPDGHSCGSGTIVDARSGEALILTCGHIFRDSKGQGKIEVDLFGPGGQKRVIGRLVSYDSENRDLGLVAIPAPAGVVTARIAPPGYQIERGMPVVSIGCNSGDAPTARHSQINSLDKFAGPPNIQVAGQPVEGRSGGGLFSREGYVIGVCNAADPSDREGLFAALGSICAELDRMKLAFIYQSPSESFGPQVADNAPAEPNPINLASWNAPVAPEPTSAAQPDAPLPPHEQAALDEIRHEKREGSEIVIIVRPRNNPEAKSEVFMLENASPEFLKQATATATAAPKPLMHKQEIHPTSFELPKPRVKVLEWSKDQ